MQKGWQTNYDEKVLTVITGIVGADGRLRCVIYIKLSGVAL